MLLWVAASMEWWKQLGQGLKQCQNGADSMPQECCVLSESITNMGDDKIACTSKKLW